VAFLFSSARNERAWSNPLAAVGTAEEPPVAVVSSREGQAIRPPTVHVEHRHSRVNLRLATARRLREVRVSPLSRWQSPTISLLRIPGNELFSSTPRLDQSEAEMKMFLRDLN
jgi:hypothetical protein